MLIVTDFIAFKRPKVVFLNLTEIIHDLENIRRARPILQLQSTSLGMFLSDGAMCEDCCGERGA